MRSLGSTVRRSHAAACLILGLVACSTKGATPDASVFSDASAIMEDLSSPADAATGDASEETDAAEPIDTSTKSTGPAQATAVGYHTITFGPAVTLNKNWFDWGFYGVGAQAMNATKQNTDGSLLITGNENNNYGATVASGKPTTTGNKWKGTAFGGGAYFEAVASFTGQGNGPYNNGGPAFWTLDIEHLSQGPYSTDFPGQTILWPGIPFSPTGNVASGATTLTMDKTLDEELVGWTVTGTGIPAGDTITGVGSGTVTLAHATTGALTSTSALKATGKFNDYFEVDFMEYDSTEYSYQNGIGNWYGPYGPNDGTSNPYEDVGGVSGSVQIPMGTDFTKDHKYGCLWVPATPTTKGYLKFYFDDALLPDTFVWMYDDPKNPFQPPPVNNATAMSGMDQRHMLLILGTGTDQPMTVKSVTVWQASAASNITQ